MNKTPGFVSRNLVAIVMIPSLILMHYGWKQLQNVDSLVKPEERKEQYPATLLYNIVEEKIKKFIHQAD